MPGFLTDYANDKTLDLFSAAAITPFCNPLLRGEYSQTASIKTGAVSEPSGGGYARVAVSNTLTNFPAASSGTKSNATAITFPTPSAAWGTVVSVFIADAAAGGNVLAMADLTTPKTINSGASAPTIAVSALYLSHT